MRNYPDSDRALDQTLCGAAAAGSSFCHTLRVNRAWRREPDTLTLAASYRLVEGDRGMRILARLGDHEVFLDEPMRLSAATVSKPWGRELWLTGIEARGESGVHTNAGVLPLSHYLTLAPRRLTGSRDGLVLLKLLDPRPEPVLGDLYVEAHAIKREVYVVSGVDPGAWAQGHGAIRYGVNQSLRRRYGDDAAFRRAYLNAVKRYEAVRRAIDAGRVPAAAQEERLRRAMEAFTDLRRVAVGDVVVVPPWLPHSLQHGVRVIEFQTPVFERYILSFNQQVATQSHWDTEAAMPYLRLDTPVAPRPHRLGEGVERIASVAGFDVLRMVLAPAAGLVLPDHGRYALCMVVAGQVQLGNLPLAAEEAAFVPAAALACGRRSRLCNRSKHPATVLAAVPDR